MIRNPDRPAPAWPPMIRPQGKPLADPCAECGQPHHGAAELAHEQEVHDGAGSRFVMLSRFPLCAQCADTASRRGWAALPATWRRVIEAPRQFLAMLLAEPAGRVQ